MIYQPNKKVQINPLEEGIACRSNSIDDYMNYTPINGGFLLSSPRHLPKLIDIFGEYNGFRARTEDRLGFEIYDDGSNLARLVNHYISEHGARKGIAICSGNQKELFYGASIGATMQYLGTLTPKDLGEKYNLLKENASKAFGSKRAEYLLDFSRSLMDEDDPWGALYSRKSAFSLVELLAVTAIILILFSLILPGINSVKDKALKTGCTNYLRQQGIVMFNYAEDYKGILPNNWKSFNDMLEGDQYNFLWLCPGDKRINIPKDKRKKDKDITNSRLNWYNSLFESYFHPTGPMEKLRLRGKYSLNTRFPTEIALSWDLLGGSKKSDYKRFRNHKSDGGNVLWLDGHVIFIEQKFWAYQTTPVFIHDMLDYKLPGADKPRFTKNDLKKLEARARKFQVVGKKKEDIE